MIRTALTIYRISELVADIIPGLMAEDWLLYSYIQYLYNK